MVTKKVEAKKVEKKPVAKAPAVKATAKVEKKLVTQKIEAPKKVEAKSEPVIAKKVDKPVVKAEIKKVDTTPIAVAKAPVEKPVEAKKPAPVAKKLAYNFKLFNRWDSNITVVDAGLRRYITLNPKLVPFSHGRNMSKQFWKSEKHIVERLILKLMVAGHKGKRQYKESGHNTGKYTKITGNVIKAFEIIE